MFENECVSDDFDPKYHPFYGNCFIYNNGKNLKSITQKGQIGSLLFEFFIGSLAASNSSEIGSGGVVFISNYSQSPFEFPEYLLNPTLKTQMGLERTYSKRLDAPYSTCRNKARCEHSVRLIHLPWIMSYEIYS